VRVLAAFDCCLSLSSYSLLSLLYAVHLGTLLMCVACIFDLRSTQQISSGFLVVSKSTIMRNNNKQFKKTECGIIAQRKRGACVAKGFSRETIAHVHVTAQSNDITIVSDNTLLKRSPFNNTL
jgi:hypothetical protein